MIYDALTSEEVWTTLTETITSEDGVGLLKQR